MFVFKLELGVETFAESTPKVGVSLKSKVFEGIYFRNVFLPMSFTWDAFSRERLPFK